MENWTCAAQRVNYGSHEGELLRSPFQRVYVVTTSAANPMGFITALTWRPCSSWTLASQWWSTVGMTKLDNSYPKDNLFNGTLDLTWVWLLPSCTAVWGCSYQILLPSLCFPVSDLHHGLRHSLAYSCSISPFILHRHFLRSVSCI